MAEILIVDDDPLVREYLAIMVDLEGHSCAAAENGAEAVTFLTTHPCDLAIVDIFMPVKEGIETICEMRQRFPETRIVAMSAGSRFMPCSQALDYAMCLGADDVLPKPFSLDTFRTVVHQTLSRSVRPAV